MGTRYGPVKFKIPNGFSTLLQRFAREVLREQPEDIVQFGATYFRSLLEEKLATGNDPLKVDPFNEPGYHGSPKKALRPINSETRQNEIKEENAAMTIQAGFRGYRVREQSRQQERERRHKRQQEEAATKIQAQYRGYRTRKDLTRPPPSDIPKAEPETEVENEQPQYGDGEEHAAICIQANFRRYRARKSLKLDRDEPKDGDSEPVANKLEPQESVTEKTVIKPESEAGEEEQEAPVDEEEDRTQPDVEDEAESPKEDIQLREEETSPDAVDSKQEAAALTIQASFRGHRTRKQLKIKAEEESKKEEPVLSEGGGDADVANMVKKSEEVLAPGDSEAQHAARHAAQRDNENDSGDATEKSDERDDVAAVKIQARYRGYRARKQLRERKEDFPKEVTAITVEAGTEHAADDQE